MAATCVITGYKIGASAIIVYGFILSGTVFNPPSPTPTTFINTTKAPTTVPTSNLTTPDSTTPSDIITQDICGLVPEPLGDGKRSVDTPIARLLLFMMTRRILGGTDTDEGDWPWMAYLYEKGVGKEGGFFCGGALINDRWIVTAAHCVGSPNTPEIYGVILGEHNSSMISANERAFDFERIIRHEEYDPSTLGNDVAVMKVAETVTFTRYIRPVCLVPSGYPTDATVSRDFNGTITTNAGTICTVLGWGQTEKNNRTEIMQQLNVIIMPHSLCSSITTNPSEPYNGRSVDVEDSKFCAGGSIGEDTCAGDSGGPLLCIHEGRYFLHGVTSYGTTPCGQERKPGVYTRLADHHEWIMANIS